LDETADVIWGQLSQYKDEIERIVALGILLTSNFVPYVQIPDDLLTLEPLYRYNEAKETVRDQIVLLMRVRTTKNISALEFAVAMTRLMDQIRTHEGKAAFLLEFLEKSQEQHLTSAIAQKIFASMKEIVLINLPDKQSSAGYSQKRPGNHELN